MLKFFLLQQVGVALLVPTTQSLKVLWRDFIRLWHLCWELTALSLRKTGIRGLVLFATLEVVQESFGFSLNELVFWHHVRGPLSLLRERLLQGNTLNHENQSEESLNASILVFIRNINVLEIPNGLHSQLTHSTDTHTYTTRHATNQIYISIQTLYSVLFWST